jgi:hypothetical protein
MTARTAQHVQVSQTEAPAKTEDVKSVKSFENILPTIKVITIWALFCI